MKKEEGNKSKVKSQKLKVRFERKREEGRRKKKVSYNSKVKSKI
ncbi:hypothetical protein [Okeania sp. KiyG1]|nr:hypothetical protein [Okeania sp. KiyG1]